jgi:hypothetical protein
MSSTLTPEVQSYLYEVVIACSDLSPKDRDQLLIGLPEHLSELAAEGVDLVTELGTPTTYALELKRAAGLTGDQTTKVSSEPSTARRPLVILGVVLTTVFSLSFLAMSLGLVSFTNIISQTTSSFDLKDSAKISKHVLDFYTPYVFSEKPDDWIDRSRVGVENSNTCTGCRWYEIEIASPDGNQFVKISTQRSLAPRAGDFGVETIEFALAKNAQLVTNLNDGVEEFSLYWSTDPSNRYAMIYRLSSRGISREDFLDYANRMTIA